MLVHKWDSLRDNKYADSVLTVCGDVGKSFVWVCRVFFFIFSGKTVCHSTLTKSMGSYNDVVG